MWNKNNYKVQISNASLEPSIRRKAWKSNGKLKFKVLTINPIAIQICDEGNRSENLHKNRAKSEGVKIISSEGLFTWSGGPGSSGVGFFCFVSPRAWKQKKPTPLDRDTPLHVNRVWVDTLYYIRTRVHW